MKTQLIKFSAQFLTPFNTDYWVGIEAIPDEGETEIEAWNKCADKALEFHQQRHGELPVIQQQSGKWKSTEERWQQASEAVDFDWLVVKEQLDNIEFMEDAQAFIEGTEYRMAWEAKKLISSKPNRPTNDK